MVLLAQGFTSTPANAILMLLSLPFYTIKYYNLTSRCILVYMEIRVTMRIVICEDNNEEQECLASAIKKWSDVRKINVDLLRYGNAEDFQFVWPDMVVDIIFLDIELKRMTGIQLAEKIRKIDKNVLIVFVTGFTQHILKGYDVDALNYLIKPLSSDKLNSVLDKAYGIWCAREKDAIIVKNDDGLIKLFYGNLYYIKMNSHTAELHTESETFKIRKTTKELREILPSYFVRCSRSYMVNLIKVDCIYENSLLLSTGEKLPISRNNAKYVRDVFVRLFKE